MSKSFNFLIEQTCIGKGYVTADTKEEAIKKIKNGEYDDIYDTVDYEDGDIIEIEEE